MSDKFSVWVFTANGVSYAVAHRLDGGTALGKALEATDLAEANRVIITDGRGDTCFEWVYNNGVTRQ